MPISWPVITDQVRHNCQAVLDSGILSGDDSTWVRELESRWASMNRASYCLAVNGGTSAIHVALAYLGVGPGSKVLTTAFTYVGTIQPILALGADPVFVDIDPETYNMDLDRAAHHLESEPIDAILPVHIHGHMVDMNRLQELANGIPIVEDACQAHTATSWGQFAGTVGVAGCFSLNWTKMLSAGEGGLILTNDRALYEFGRAFRYTGEDLDAPAVLDTRPFTIRQRGLNYLMPELTAAVACAQCPLPHPHSRRCLCLRRCL